MKVCNKNITLYDTEKLPSKSQKRSFKIRIKALTIQGIANYMKRRGTYYMSKIIVIRTGKDVTT